jgi:CspA family cold shock protein
MQGRVAHWNPERGFGFIAINGEPDVFAHVSQVEDGFDPLINDLVNFEIEIDTQGRRKARNVFRAD